MSELEDIINEINPKEGSRFFTDSINIHCLIELIFEFIDDFVKENVLLFSDPEYKEILYENIKEYCIVIFENILECENFFLQDLDFEDELNDLILLIIDLYLIHTNQEAESSIEHTSNNFDFIKNQIEYLKNIPQPDQRTEEWYNYRHNLITASNAYKAFESISMQNQLIYEKCQPIQIPNNDTSKMTNINTPFHWGQKFEPVSTMLYEYIYNTEVTEFGCIPHKYYNFIGASPDGIVTNEESERYGRLLEIKNVVSRTITGIPKKEYWVQMQLQMEVCDLDYCDFLETKFIEYEKTEFYADNKSEYKGVILYFHDQESNKPHYIYKPLNIQNTEEEIFKWQAQYIDKYEKENNEKFIWIKNIYWKLDVLSCVLITRNKTWFKNNLPQLQNIWNTILKERETGYDHRMPQKKQSANITTESFPVPPEEKKYQCLLVKKVL